MKNVYSPRISFQKATEIFEGRFEYSHRVVQKGISVLLNAVIIFSLTGGNSVICSAQNAERQSKAISDIVGSWLLQDTEIREGGKEADSTVYAKCFWADHKTIPLEISSNGSLSYSREKQWFSGSVKDENGSLAFYFPSGKVSLKSDQPGSSEMQGSSFSVSYYQYSVDRNHLVLIREDPEFFQRFTFKRQ